MRQSNEFSAKLRRGHIHDNGNFDGLSSNLSEDESAEVSSEEQSDILDFFVKEGGSAAADVSVINLSDEDDAHDIPVTNSVEGLSKNSKYLPIADANTDGNAIIRKRGRPPKNRGPLFESKGASSNSGRTKLDFKSGLQSTILTPQRSLNCAIKFGEPVGIIAGMRKSEKSIKVNDDLDSDLAVLNRPKRSATQKQNNSCSTDEENFNITWQEMRDLEKALAASLKRKDITSVDSNAAVQRKFVTSDQKPLIHIPKKRGRKRKEPINVVVLEKAYTEDFINFLCNRPISVKNCLPSSRDLFLNCVHSEAKPAQVNLSGRVQSVVGEEDSSNSLDHKSHEDVTDD